MNKNQDHLYRLYTKWGANKKLHEVEMASTIDKIIYSTIAKKSNLPFYRRFEEKEDLIQDLRFLCFQKLSKSVDISLDKYSIYLKSCQEKNVAALKYPVWCNKTLFNYIRITIEYHLLDKNRKVGKQMDREEVEDDILGENRQTNALSFCFGDGILDQVATLLAHGQTKQNICSELKISRVELQDAIERIKETLHEERPARH
jgi:hypothetical protein